MHPIIYDSKAPGVSGRLQRADSGFADEVFVDDNGVVPLSKEAFSRGRSESALPQAASRADLMAPPAFIQGDKRPKPGPLTPLCRGRSQGLVETEKLPTPPPRTQTKTRKLADSQLQQAEKLAKRAKAAAAKKNKASHSKQVSELHQREV